MYTKTPITCKVSRTSFTAIYTPPLLIFPSLLGQEKPASSDILKTLQPNLFLKNNLNYDMAYHTIFFP